MFNDFFNENLNRERLYCILIVLVFQLWGNMRLFAQFTATIIEINPNQSTLDPTDPDGASGGRVNGLAIASDGRTCYAASEWGGIYKSTDAGLTWFRLNGHLPVATWDVEVDPSNPNKIYATSFYDGRIKSLAGINVSNNGGITWIHPASARPPSGNYTTSARRDEPSAFGISIDPNDTQNVCIGTNAGLAISNDAGTTWRYVDPTPTDTADNIWDVVVHDGGIIDLVGDDGHQRSTNGGVTWTTATGLPLPSARGSIVVSPHESDVLFAAVGVNLYESDDGGNSWTMLGTPDQRRARQGRIPFVAANPRSASTFDLWYGDIRLYRGACNSNPAGGGLRCPMAYTGPPLAPSAPSLPLPAGWNGPYTRTVGGHDDVAEIVFNPISNDNACPMLFSSDGGIYYNTLLKSPSCQDPIWEQPRVTPHGLWLFSMDGADRPGLGNEDLYFGNQDNGTFASTNAAAVSPTWINRNCCDGFDIVADPSRVVYTVCCGTSLFLTNPGMTGGGVINTPPGNLPGFRPIDIIDQFGPDDYVVVTTSGVFITNNITASSIIWTQLGTATSPANAGGVKVGILSGIPTFYVQSGNCDGRSQDQLWSYTGTAPSGAWQQIAPPGGTGGFGIYDVDHNNPDRLIASHLRSNADPQMILSLDGGANWTILPVLDNLMTGGGVFRYQNQRGPTNFTSFAGYPQPTLVAFDPDNSNIIFAGGADSGVFASIDGGHWWTRLTDPINPVSSGIPHIPRPQFAYFDHKPPSGSTENLDVYIGTQGRGVWRVSLSIEAYRYEYAAKFVCGVQKDPKNLRLARGAYATAINIHNPNDKNVKFFKKLALTFPPEGQRPGKIIPLGEDVLKPDQALEVDCEEINRVLRENRVRASYSKGFVVIQSQASLDIVAVYTTASLDRNGRISDHSSIDVERIQERIRKTEKQKDLPDLIPLPKAKPLEGPRSFCKIRDGKLVVTVKNQGPGSAGSSVTEVDFINIKKTVMSTSALASGASTDLLFDIPPGTGESFKFKITVDRKNSVSEINEGNNTADGVCNFPQ